MLSSSLSRATRGARRGPQHCSELPLCCVCDTPREMGKGVLTAERVFLARLPEMHRSTLSKGAQLASSRVAQVIAWLLRRYRQMEQMLGSKVTDRLHRHQT